MNDKPTFFEFRYPLATRVGWLAFACALLALSGFAFAMGAATDRKVQLLATQGVVVEAVIIDKFESVVFKKREVATSYTLVIAYVPQGRERFESEMKVPRNQYDGTRVGDQMMVRYAVSDPRVFMTLSEAAKHEGQFGWLFLLGSAIVAAAYGWQPKRGLAQRV